MAAREQYSQTPGDGGDERERQSNRRTECFGRKMQHRAREGEADKTKHGVGHDGRRSRPADTAVQNEHDADEYHWKHRKNAAAGWTKLKAEGHNDADEQRDQPGTQCYVGPARAKRLHPDMPQWPRQPQANAYDNEIHRRDTGITPLDLMDSAG